MIKAHLTEAPFGDSLQVFIVDRHEDGYQRILHMEGDAYQWEELPHAHTAITEPVEPTVTLPWDTGRALLDALTRHYQGAEDTRALRRDYDAERKRVDEQSRVIADIARALAARGGA